MAAIYAESARSALMVLRRNWIILPASLALLIVWLVTLLILNEFGMVGAFMLGIIQIALISTYYAWISAAVDREKLTIPSMLKFDVGLFFSLIGVAFILSIADILFKQPFQNSLEYAWVPACAGLVVFILFNAVPEVVHHHRYDSLPSLASAFQFNKENWIEWYLPLVILIIPSIIVDWRATLVLVASTDVLLPISFLVKALNTALPSPYIDLGYLLRQIPILIAGTWFMFFRAYLFRELEHGTRRRRIYLMKNR